MNKGLNIIFQSLDAEHVLARVIWREQDSGGGSLTLEIPRPQQRGRSQEHRATPGRRSRPRRPLRPSLRGYNPGLAGVLPVMRPPGDPHDTTTLPCHGPEHAARADDKTSS